MYSSLYDLVYLYYFTFCDIFVLFLQMSGRPGGSKRVRYFGGVREETVEEEDDDTDSLRRYQGLKEATGEQGTHTNLGENGVS